MVRLDVNRRTATTKTDEVLQVVARKDPKALYELAPGTPGLAGVVLLHQMEGFMDAGGAGRLAWSTSWTSSTTAWWRPSTWTGSSTTAAGAPR